MGVFHVGGRQELQKPFLHFVNFSPTVDEFGCKRAYRCIPQKLDLSLQRGNGDLYSLFDILRKLDVLDYFRDLRFEGFRKS